jgi:sulfate adenylyltransferase
MRSDELSHLQRFTLTERQRLDLEQILCGAFAPLTGFLTEAEYDVVVSSMRLTSGDIWPMPIVLDVPDTNTYEIGERVLLCDGYGYPVAIFTVSSRYHPDKHREALAVYGTDDVSHPGVRYLIEETGTTYLGGPVELVAFSPVHDFVDLRLSPEQTKRAFAERNWQKVVAFQTRNPLHRAHFEIISRSMDDAGANALIHPVAGLTKEGDIDYVRRVRGYQRVANTYFGNRAMLAILPLAMRMAGPREALWHALIRKNYGATHFIVGRDHAGLGTQAGRFSYDPFAAQNLAAHYEEELGITIIRSPEMVFSAQKKVYVPKPELAPHDTALHISGSEFRRMLTEREPVPDWFAFPEVVEELRSNIEHINGAVLFFTGLPSAGKTTIACILYQKLLEKNISNIQLLDGDVVRATSRTMLGFNRSDRNANVKRIGAMALSCAQSGGIAICAAVAPHAEARDANRIHMEHEAIPYIEIFVDTPIAVCEQRDPKGLYKKARAGIISHFTGVDDPYEKPYNAEIVLDTESHSPDENADIILAYLRKRRLL